MSVIPIDRPREAFQAGPMMSELHEAQSIDAGPTTGADLGSVRKKKKKDKVRSAWISFFGRILAQILGAVASIVLGLYVLQKYQALARSNPAATSTPDAAPVRVSAPRSPGVVALAVLPLANFSGHPGQDHFANGLTEALIAELSQLDGLRVISRTSSMRYKNHQKSMPQIAQELGVDVIVEASVVRSGERVRVSAQLIDATRDEHIWARSYDHTVRDILALQRQVAAAIATAVKDVLTARLAPQ